MPHATPPFALPWVTYYGAPGQAFHCRVLHSCATDAQGLKAALFGQIHPSRYRSRIAACFRSRSVIERGTPWTCKPSIIYCNDAPPEP